MEGEREEPGESTGSGTTSARAETVSPGCSEENAEARLLREGEDGGQADRGGCNGEAEPSQEVGEDQCSSGTENSEETLIPTDIQEGTDSLPVSPLPTEEEPTPPTEEEPSPPTESSRLSPTQSRPSEPCFYCLRSLDSSIRPEAAKQEDSEPSSRLPSSGQKVSYQTDPRPHFGVAWSSHSTCRPLWGSEGPCWGQRHQEMPDQTDTCPHCHLGLPPDTLRWHEAKCLLFEGLRNSKK